MKTQSLLLVIAICLGCQGISWSQEQPAEPVYDGKSLALWVRQLESCDILGDMFHPPTNVVQAIQAIGPKAVPDLVKWMGLSVNQNIRIGHGMSPNKPRPAGVPTDREVAMAFRILGTNGKAAIPDLEDIAAGPYYKTSQRSTFVAAIDSLAFLGPEVVPFMLKQATILQGEDVSSEALIIERLGWMGTNGEAAIPALITWAGGTNAWIRRAAIGSLGYILRKPEMVVPVLIAATKDKDQPVRWHAAIGLGNFGKDAKSAVPNLIKLLKDPDTNVREMAILSLGKIGEDRKTVVPLLIRQLKSSDFSLQCAAATALGEFGGTAAVKALVEAKDDSSATVRNAVLKSLKALESAPADKLSK